MVNIRSPSSISASVSSSSSSSQSRSGTSPSEQSAIQQAWIFCSLLSSQISSLQPEQHLPEQWDILMSPVTQLMSGLCFRNQVWPIITFCLPRLVTAKNTCSAWFRYRRFSSTTSVMDPASLGVCQRTPQSTSHYSRLPQQSPIHPSTQTTKPPDRSLTYVSDLRVQLTCPTYVSGLRVHPTCPTIGPHYYFNYLSPLTPY